MNSDVFLGTGPKYNICYETELVKYDFVIGNNTFVTW